VDSSRRRMGDLSGVIGSGEILSLIFMGLFLDFV